MFSLLAWDHQVPGTSCKVSHQSRHLLYLWVGRGSSIPGERTAAGKAGLPSQELEIPV